MQTVAMLGVRSGSGPNAHRFVSGLGGASPTVGTGWAEGNYYNPVKISDFTQGFFLFPSSLSFFF